jgi:predicted tellurium resistance membrane protein TerC
MDFFSRPDLWIAFLTLFALEIVLGIDNVVFISILSDKLPPEQRRKARLLGLSLAMIFRIALLFATSWVLASPHHFSRSDLGMPLKSADAT